MCLLVVAAALALDTERAIACSCSPDTLEEMVEGALSNDAVLLFTGTETGAETIDDGARLALTFDVERVFSGPKLGPTETFYVPLGTSCGGGSFAAAGRAVFRAFRQPETGVYNLGFCGNAFSVDEVEAIIDGLPVPAGDGPPGFVVMHSLGDSRMALLDDQGRVLKYDTEFDRHPLAIATCPGGKRFVVASTSENPTYSDEEFPDLQLDTFRIRDFKKTIERETTMRRHSGGPDSVESLRCHDRRGHKLTYLLASFRHDELWGGPEHNTGSIHRWKRTELTETEAGTTRAVAANRRGTIAWTVNGRNGNRLSRWDLRTGQQLATRQMPEDVTAWTIDHLGGSTIGIIGRVGRIPLNRTNRGYRGAGHLLLGSFGELQLFDLPVPFDGKFPPAIISSQTDDGTLHALYRGRYLSIETTGTITKQRLRSDRFIDHLAFGESINLTNGATKSGVGTLNPRTGRTRNIEGIAQGNLIASFHPTAR